MGSMQNQQRWGSLLVNLGLLLLILIWTIPTLGLFISSFRNRDSIQNSGWWNVFPHRTYETVATLTPAEMGLDPTGPMVVEGVETTFEEIRKTGVTAEDGTFYRWVGNRRLGRIEQQEQKWAVDWSFTLDNYRQVLSGKSFEYKRPDGSIQTIPGDNFVSAFLNSLAVAVPATVIPILVAAFAAYGFAWMRFPGRRLLFIMVVALLVVPLQVALVPILRDFNMLKINGTFLAMWMAHTGFGLPLATYLLFNYISQLPRETLESAFIDGASHFTVFRKLILPLSVPALASFAIFQFLWVWNDYLVAIIFLGGSPETKVITQRLADIVGSRGSDWHLLTAGAFLTMLLPMIVFFSLQRFFVRGLLAGSVKG